TSWSSLVRETVRRLSHRGQGRPGGAGPQWCRKPPRARLAYEFYQGPGRDAGAQGSHRPRTRRQIPRRAHAQRGTFRGRRGRPALLCGTTHVSAERQRKWPTRYVRLAPTSPSPLMVWQLPAPRFATNGDVGPPAVEELSVQGPLSSRQ